ncbi:iron complex outermembrane recepter protein [bacterium A37T11]|nr:iron complex outermembrane recepter protein [bacterium A37T11]
MNQFLYLVVFILATQSVAAQQNFQIKGIVLTADGKPAEGVSVRLVGLGIATKTSANGEYSLQTTEKGTFTLRISSVGLMPIEKQITIKDATVQMDTIRLAESAETLEEVVISTSKPNPFVVRRSRNVAKIPLGNLENPQVYTTITRQLLDEQVTTDLTDALKNTPGILKMQGSPGRAGDGGIYYNLRGFSTRITMVDGMPAQTNGETDVANIERVEVIKGPSGALYGGALTTFGGLINVVTKKPVDTLGGEVSYTAGNLNLSRIAADIYGPIDKGRKLTARLNAAYHKQNTFQDNGHRQSTFLAPVLDYRLNDRVQITLGAEFYQYEGTNPSIVFLARTRQFFARTPKELHFDWNRSYTNDDMTLKAPSSNVHGQLNVHLSGSWTSQTNFSRNSRKTDGIYQYLFVRGNESDDALERNVQLQNYAGASTGIQQNFIGDVKVAGLRNRIIVGLDYLNQELNNNLSAIVKYDTVSGSNPGANYGKISNALVTEKIVNAGGALTRNHSSSNVYSAYASDLINITGQLMAMLSLRVDRFQSLGQRNISTGVMTDNSKYGQTAWSPKFGLVYQLLKDRVSLFGNYMNGFSNLEPVSQPLDDISGVLKPQQANQWEGGVKVDLLNNRLNLTASYYDISVTNMVRTEVVEREGVAYNISVQDGTQKSKGMELELIANPLKGLNIVAGFSHNDSKYEKADANVNGRRPGSAGPADVANGWISYTLWQGKVKGLGAGFGINYVGKHLTANTLTTGVFTFPSYTLLQATVYYDGPRFRLGLKVNNLTDEHYFTGQGVISPQMPRNVAANLTVKF